VVLLLAGQIAAALLVTALLPEPAYLLGVPAPLLLAIGVLRRRPWGLVLAAPLLALQVVLAGLLSGALAALAAALWGAAALAPLVGLRWWFFPRSPLEEELLAEAPNPRRPRQLAYLLLVFALLFAAQQALGPTLDERERHDLSVAPVRAGLPPRVVLATTALGGFRSIFIDLLWLRAVAMKEEGKFFEMVQLYDWITNLQPHYSMVWRFVAWDLAYNVSVDIDDLHERWFWIYRGIRTLRDKGIPYNPEDPFLYYELSWIFHHKVGKAMDYANRIYQARLADLMEAVLQGPGDRALLERLVATPGSRRALLLHPDLEPLAAWFAEREIDPVEAYPELTGMAQVYEPEVYRRLRTPEGRRALERVRLFRMRRQLQEEFKLEPELMLRLNREYGPIDWRGPNAHSLYWAWRAREVREEQLDENMMDLKFERLIYFSLQELHRRGRIHRTSDGYVYSVPDYRFMRATVEHLRSMLQRAEESVSPRGKEVNVTGSRSGYTYLLERCVFMYYFNGDVEAAEPFMEYLREEHPEKEKYQVRPAVFVRENIQEFVESMSLDRFHLLLDGILRQAFYFRSIQDGENAAAQENYAEALHRYAAKRWPYDPLADEEQYRYVAPFEEYVANMLIRILEGAEPGFSEQMRQRLFDRLSPAQRRSLQERAKVLRQRQERLRSAPEGAE
jgi:hypothetical protein